jgi:hypothetical protein
VTTEKEKRERRIIELVRQYDNKRAAYEDQKGADVEVKSYKAQILADVACKEVLSKLMREITGREWRS